MSTVEIRAGSQICKGQPQVAARHLKTNVPYPRNFALHSGLTNTVKARHGLAVGRKGKSMFSSGKKSHKHWVEWFPMLVLFSILAGAAGGLAVGVMTSHTSSSTTSTAQ